MQRVFVGICVFCAFYSVIAAGVFNYFGRPLSYDLLKLVHGVATVESSIRDRLTLPVAVALIGSTRRLLRADSPPGSGRSASGDSGCDAVGVVRFWLLATTTISQMSGSSMCLAAPKVSIFSAAIFR